MLSLCRAGRILVRSTISIVVRRNGLEKLSMGMSDDFETAIAFGATSVRVGSAVTY